MVDDDIVRRDGRKSVGFPPAALRLTIDAGIDAQVAHHDVVRLHVDRSEEHTSELQSLMRISYAVFCLKKKKIKTISTENKLTLVPQRNNKKSKHHIITDD